MKRDSKFISFCKASVILLSLIVPVMPCAASQTSTNQAAFDTSVYDDVLDDYRAIYSDDVITENMVSMNVNVGNGWVRYKSPDLQYAYVDLVDRKSISYTNWWFKIFHLVLPMVDDRCLIDESVVVFL